MDASVNDEFHAHANKDITRHGRTKDCTHVVNGCDVNIVSRSEWESMFDKKEIAKKTEPGLANLVVEDFISLKKNKLCSTNLVVENSS